VLGGVRVILMENAESRSGWTGRPNTLDVFWLYALSIRLSPNNKNFLDQRHGVAAWLLSRRAGKPSRNCETEKLRETVFMDIFSVIFYYVGYVQP
jgi:hypothetical protein